MNEYVVLAYYYANPSDFDSEVVEWKVGTLEQSEFWYKKCEKEGYTVHIRKCSHPLNAEHLFAGVPLKS
jgi:hypothetical protein